MHKRARLTSPLMVGLLASAVSPSSAAQQAAPPPPIEQLYKMPAVYSVPGMNKVQIKRDIVYKSADTEKGKTDLKLDHYAPADAAPGKVYPVVILISGGGFEGAPYDWRDAGVYNSYGRLLAATGFTAIAFSKRYSRGPAGTLCGAEDLRSLVDYLDAHAAELSVDKSRKATWSFSAGGLLMALALRESSWNTRAVICFYCVADVNVKTWSNVEGVTPEALQRAVEKLSPLGEIRNGIHAFPAIFVGRAGLDSEALNQTIDSFSAAGLSKNLSIEVMNHPTGRHGFDILDPNDRSREIIRRALEFLGEHLKPR